MTDGPQLAYFTDLIEHNASVLGDKPYILWGEEKISFGRYYQWTCRAANGLKAQGAQPGDGVAILMGNCPEYLYCFYGMPMGGYYTVPVNVSLKGDGLQFILTHSDVKYLVVDDTLYPTVVELEKLPDAIQKIFVRRTTDQTLPEGTIDLQELLSAPSDKPDHVLEEGAINNMMYTSGTTGFPKGVVDRNRAGTVEWFRMVASMIINKEEDTLYTALPLFHANALRLTAGFAMCGEVAFGLDPKFSASGFWDRIRHYGATQFNAIGAMIPILMKQPPQPNDGDNPVRIVHSAACPANLWKAFEERFNVTIWEAYGAVDGGGVTISNPGDAPVGSVGKPAPHVVWKLVDDDGNEVSQGEPGELISKVLDKKTGSVEYYKNPEATSKKIKGEWLHSGDLFYADKDGNLYFVDRKSDSMRRRGENISSWEVENVVEKHPAVAICAAFGVPSELGEDEVMIWVKTREGAELDLRELMRFCGENMAHFMVPRYVDVVDDIPRTGTLRVQKAGMKKQGVTDRTWDREKEMPDLKLR
ncbi:MAG: AMP-binding protein [Deltaproteobacteria bacterium]|jgi:crotonobetaine/carnitine-CoA ligase|nr:AMP-binding protein [Deltaproteobacteria bacterium]